MRFLKDYTETPNILIDDTIMHYTSKVVYVAMALCQRKSGLVKLTIAELVEKSGLCEATVMQALEELEAGHYIKRKRNWRFSKGLNRAVIASNTYKLCRNRSSGYTLIRASIFSQKITPATFCVLLFLYRCAGRNQRAFPSIRYIAGAWKEKTGRGLDMAKSTVQLALKLLKELQAFDLRHCDTKRGCKSNNSYYMTDMVLKKSGCTKFQNIVRGLLPHGGGPIFWDTSPINKIT